jgi:hypothetical protein
MRVKERECEGTKFAAVSAMKSRAPSSRCVPSVSTVVHTPDTPAVNNLCRFTPIADIT